MGEPKPIASLSSSLLARKGHAKPAMRPQGFAGFGMVQPHHHQDDLGWNDMGHAMAEPQPISADIVPILPEAVEAPEVVRQQEALERELAPEPVAYEPPVYESAAYEPVTRSPRAAPGSKAKAAFTLRLDRERHLKLRLVCAVQHRSAQQIVLAALDAFLDDQPSVAALTRAANKPA